MNPYLDSEDPSYKDIEPEQVKPKKNHDEAIGIITLIGMVTYVIVLVASWL